MNQTNKRTGMTVENYLAHEESAAQRHEYVDGQMFSMTGVTKRHNIIAGNIFAILKKHVRGSHCRAYMSDVKVRIESTNSFYYPDVMVSCEAYDSSSAFTACPVLIVEVLSRSTAAIDRREKMFAYRQLESLTEYLIVYQTKQRVEIHRKDIDRHWEILKFEQGSEFEIDSIPTGGLKITLDEVYEDVDWQPNTGLRVREAAADEEDLQSDDLSDW